MSFSFLGTIEAVGTQGSTSLHLEAVPLRTLAGLGHQRTFAKRAGLYTTVYLMTRSGHTYVSLHRVKRHGVAFPASPQLKEYGASFSPE